MKKGTFFYILIALLLSATQPTKACVCLDEYSPVCGANGVTYASGCYARCEGEPTYTDGICSDSKVNGLWKRLNRASLNLCNVKGKLYGNITVRGIINNATVIKTVSPSLVKGKNDILLEVLGEDNSIYYVGIRQMKRKSKIKIKVYRLTQIGNKVETGRIKRRRKIALRKTSNEPLTCNISVDEDGSDPLF